VSHFYRPNNWPNTPDILPQYLQYGGKSAFIIRLALAATLCPSYGIYGPAFELCENRALKDGSEEYLDSEKYEVRHWDLDRPDGIFPVVARINKVRRESPALQRQGCPHFHASDNERILCYSKASGTHGDVMLCVVNLDPHYTQQGHLRLDLAALGVTDDGRFQVHDLLTDARFIWHGPDNYVELDPRRQPAYIFRVRQTLRSEADFEYFS
jgi:starch synthase (maltosyl-transferring)